jgi:hypothetical protein
MANYDNSGKAFATNKIFTTAEKVGRDTYILQNGRPRPELKHV